MRIQFRVLGPLTAELDGEPVDLGGRRPRMVLASLIAAQGRVLSTDRLVEQVWNDGPPPTTATLFSYVAALRRALEPDRAARTPARVLVREGTGYAIRVPPETIDAERFTGLVTTGDRQLDRGDPNGALESLSDALALWRGQAYGDFVDAPFTVPEVARLESLRAVAREQRLAAMLAVGEHSTAIGELEALVIDHPLRERGWELLAVALYRAGRQGDALAVLRQARERLAADLGSDPGPGLLRVQAAILNQDESLGQPVGDVAAPRRHTGVALPASRNVSAAHSSFVGRAADLATLSGLLAAHRLTTVTGPGGIGKTRLVLEVCRERADADGPWVVELAGLREPTLVAQTVADTIGIPGHPSTAELATVLAEREMVLVLDNAEHLLPAVAELARTLLGRCPGIRLIVTTRQPLAVAGEAVFEVLPLPSEEAVELLVQRIASVVPGTRSAGVDRATARQVCRELDGLPLAIELAAAQSRALSLREIAFQLDDRFTLLDTGHGDGHRHSTLENTIGWSYNLLTEAEQCLFRQLSVFDGGFDLDAVRLVGADPRVPQVVPALIGLVRKSLVTSDTETVPRRYRMLESVRLYAATLLRDGELRAAQERHRNWLLGIVETGEQRLPTADGASWLIRLGLERDNIRAAAASALDAGDALCAARICGALAWFWYRTGQIDEGLRWSRRTLAALDDGSPPADADQGEWTLARARLLMAVGGVSYLAGEHAAAIRALRTSADLCQRVGARDAHTTAVIYLASVTAISGDIVSALPLADQAVQLAEEVNRPWALAEALTVRAQLSRACTDLPRARAELARANEIARSCGHRWALMSADWVDSKVSVDLGMPGRARDTLTARLLESDPAADRSSWLATAHSLAGALGRTGRPEVGAVLLGAVASLGTPIGYFPERMDPFDSPGDTAAVRAALDDRAFEAGLARGRQLGWGELVELIGSIAGPARR
ncbi:AfsR/SARP family transcriptional regulator [Polymorphospora rubra]|uniref:SARP family transcriptional regulator n=1 Tax=Polymorphospora rubra TaxID=338584 RepID=A0A810NDD1_9ACTN|nr:BTAD domain-containing putative transcriptional regulator [Polymorphospora rubra]BCJ70079.1 SARP family transcriptional regulator [Polymorphospora rubra]